jgi:hypothetical protein
MKSGRPSCASWPPRISQRSGIIQTKSKASQQRSAVVSREIGADRFGGAGTIAASLDPSCRTRRHCASDVSPAAVLTSQLACLPRSFAPASPCFGRPRHQTKRPAHAPVFLSPCLGPSPRRFPLPPVLLRLPRRRLRRRIVRPAAESCAPCGRPCPFPPGSGDRR